MLSLNVYHFYSLILFVSCALNARVATSRQNWKNSSKCSKSYQFEYSSNSVIQLHDGEFNKLMAYLLSCDSMQNNSNQILSRCLGEISAFIFKCDSNNEYRQSYIALYFLVYIYLNFSEFISIAVQQGYFYSMGQFSCDMQYQMNLAQLRHIGYEFDSTIVIATNYKHCVALSTSNI